MQRTPKTYRLEKVERGIARAAFVCDGCGADVKQQQRRCGHCGGVRFSATVERGRGADHVDGMAAALKVIRNEAEALHMAARALTAKRRKKVLTFIGAIRRAADRATALVLDAPNPERWDFGKADGVKRITTGVTAKIQKAGPHLARAGAAGDRDGVSLHQEPEALKSAPSAESDGGMQE